MHPVSSEDHPASYQSDDTLDDWKATCGYYIVSFEGTGAGDGMYEMFEVAVLNLSLIHI